MLTLLCIRLTQFKLSFLLWWWLYSTQKSSHYNSVYSVQLIENIKNENQNKDCKECENKTLTPYTPC